MTTMFPAFPRAAKMTARIGAAAALAGVMTLTDLGAADAHVRVIADNATSGSFSALTFRVPNESDSVGTVKVSVQLPQDSPFLYVSSKPVPGWKAVSSEEKLPKPVVSEGTTLTKAVRTVTWTAERGTQIGPGQYQEFSLSVGPLPGAGTVLLPATQTYSDGEVVRWDQPTPASGEEPEHPAPELVVAAATATAPGSTPEASQPAPSAPSSVPASAQASTSDPVARWLGGGSLVVAAAGLGVALTSRRRSATPSA